MKFSGFREHKRPSQLKFSMMKIKEDFPKTVGCQIQNLCLLDKICGNNLEE